MDLMLYLSECLACVSKLINIRMREGEKEDRWIVERGDNETNNTGDAGMSLAR